MAAVQRPGALARLRPDPFVLTLLAMVVLASIAPARGVAADALHVATEVLITALFFLHGARLSREAVLEGLGHWRLHVTVLAATFGVFPLLGAAFSLLPEALLPAPFATGIVFLCCLPSTVQSSIAFTAVARGNVAAAVCSASISNLLGIGLTPLLAGLLLKAEGGGVSLASLRAIVLQLLVPFIAGQIARRWIGRWVAARKTTLSLVDRASIVLVVYAAFGEAVVNGLWQRTSPAELGRLVLVCAVLLALVLAVTTFGSRVLGFSLPDEITIVFCGSKKSLATGVPMAGILFAPTEVGLVVLPLMLFHQIQLMVGAVLARHWAARPEPTAAS